MKNKSFPKLSYSQSGEDLIIRFVFDNLEIKNPSYIDIGAYDPYEYSNTAIFYKDGSRGINLEPLPDQYQKFLIDRKEDINLNIAISDKTGETDFSIMPNKKLSRMVNYTGKDETSSVSQRSIIKIKTTTIMSVLQNYCNKTLPDFLSIDTEGSDLQILKSIDYNYYSPHLICIETMTHSQKRGGSKKIDEIFDFLESKGYFVYANTYINSIFVRKKSWFTITAI